MKARHIVNRLLEDGRPVGEFDNEPGPTQLIKSMSPEALVEKFIIDNPDGWQKIMVNALSQLSAGLKANTTKAISAVIEDDFRDEAFEVPHKIYEYYGIDSAMYTDQDYEIVDGLAHVIYGYLSDLARSVFKQIGKTFDY